MKKIAIIFTVLLGFTVTNSYALNTQQMGAQYLTDIGKSYYTAGNNLEAAHKFSQALLIDGNNEEAHIYMGKMGYTQGWYEPLKTTQQQRQQSPQPSIQGRNTPPGYEQYTTVNKSKDLEFHVLRDKLAETTQTTDSMIEGMSKRIPSKPDQMSEASQQVENKENSTASEEFEPAPYTKISGQVAKLMNTEDEMIDQQKQNIEHRVKYEDRLDQLKDELVALKNKAENQARVQKSLISQKSISHDVAVLRNQKDLMGKIDELSNTLAFLDDDIAKLKEQKLDIDEYKAQLENLEKNIKDADANLEDLKSEREILETK